MSRKDKFVYSVEAEPEDGSKWIIKKYTADGKEPVSTYIVTVPESRPLIANLLSEHEVHCDCMGFKMQKKYPLTQHKHVLLALKHIELGGVSTGKYGLTDNNTPIMLVGNLSEWQEVE